MAKEREGALTRVKVAHTTPKVSHLRFADDTTIYCMTTKAEMRCVKEILVKYELATGQLINIDKSSMIFNQNIPAELCEELASILGIRVEQAFSNYLGRSAIIGQSKSSAFKKI
ncbi:hypothetical protein Sango_2758200 [Sesamum angolense]|uniref:Reverse transcriptase domain-containing protein n=1 Tax=Sesamum angolense TaxID=2727404 RepID=A0AAE1T8U2_9LAMI|nr:hypothetical protein Sango_2758200 [Sesamum angolense]